MTGLHDSAIGDFTRRGQTTLMFFRMIGEVLHGERADYGEQIVVTLALQLEAATGSRTRARLRRQELRHMLRFA
jgi:hypothetical protein